MACSRRAPGALFGGVDVGCAAKGPARLLRCAAALLLVMLLAFGAPGLQPAQAWAAASLDDRSSEAVNIARISVEAIGFEVSSGGGSGEVLSVPRLCPTVLAAQVDPSSAEVGIDCGMEDMCGIAPCLCGSADAWGGCSCNGMDAVEAEVSFVSTDETVVRVEQAFGRTWLVPVSPGEATLRCVASLQNYEDASQELRVRVDGVTAADACMVAAAVVLLAALTFVACVVAQRVWHCFSRLASVVLCVAALLGAGCAQVQVGDNSPQVESVQIAVVGQQTEASQGVEVKLAFDRQISATSNVADDFEVLLNGEPIDEEAVRLEVRASAQAVTFALRPAEGAALGPGSGAYFALYAGQFSLAAVREDGALPSITGADGSCAVLAQPLQATLPSGLAIEMLSVRPGLTEENTPAQTMFRVSSPARVRSITWFSPDGGQTKLLKHNHAFVDADTADCASDLAKVVNGAAVGLTASAQGDEVCLTAQEVVDGQVIEPVIVEGLGVEGGSYDASQGNGGGA